jgi:hypothetical protein
MLVYISGKISGLDYKHALNNFNNAEKKLNEQGYNVINPMRAVPFDPDKEWIDYMELDLDLMVNCDAIFLMPNWKDSTGARIEKRFAEVLHLTEVKL